MKKLTTTIMQAILNKQVRVCYSSRNYQMNAACRQFILGRWSQSRLWSVVVHRSGCEAFHLVYLR